MTSNSCQDGNMNDDIRDSSLPGASLFVGSFNINSSDLTKEDAKAWLAKAVDADIVALGLQECATLPAKPFPTPTNGKNVVMRQESLRNPHRDQPPLERNPLGSNVLHDSKQIVVDAEHGNVYHGKPSKSRGSSVWPFPMTMASLVHAVKRINSKKSSRDIEVDTEPTEMTAGDASLDSSMDLSGMAIDKRREAYAGSRAGGVNNNTSGMRQESYYLRGRVEEAKDADFLDTIRHCIPGRELVADVAMGETPTYGKKEVKICAAGAPKSNGTATSSHDIFNAKKHSSVNGQARGATGPAANGAVDAGGNVDAAGAGHGAASESKSVEWYGTIRVLVFVRTGLYKGLKVETVVIPAGDKPSVVGDAPLDYAKDTSPDKGAVACHLQDPTAEVPLNLLLVNCHLCGTNKYGVPEDRFDQVRIAQLKDIGGALKASLPYTSMGRLVLFGDLNFRVELHDAAEDKKKGGRDFQAVAEIAQQGKPTDLRALYEQADRLRPLVARNAETDLEHTYTGPRGRREGDGEEDGAAEEAGGRRRERQRNKDGHRCDSISDRRSKQHHEKVRTDTKSELTPDLLRGLKDGLGVALDAGEVVRPTFTFQPSGTTPRRYWDKRTPSWTDRILWRGFTGPEQGGVQEFASVPEIIISDHEPVYCLLGLARKPET